MTAGRCRTVTLPDGSRARIQGDLDPEMLQTLKDEVTADQERRCHAPSDVPMPQIAQRIHGRKTYRCGLYRGHDGPHRWPESGRVAEWDEVGR